MTDRIVPDEVVEDLSDTDSELTSVTQKVTSVTQ